MQKDLKALFLFLFSFALLIISSYQIIKLCIYVDLNNYNFGRITGNCLILILGLVVFGYARKYRR